MLPEQQGGLDVWCKSAVWCKLVVWHKSQLTLPLFAQGLRARNIIHAKIEENIRAKMARKEPEGGYKDALQLLMEHTQGNGEQLNMQVRFPPSRSISSHPPSVSSMFILGTKNGEQEVPSLCWIIKQPVQCTRVLGAEDAARLLNKGCRVVPVRTTTCPGSWVPTPA